VRPILRFRKFELQLSAAAQLSLQQSALERAGLLEEEPRAGAAAACASLQHAIEPLALVMRPAVRDRPHCALSLVYGIEPSVILKDILGLPDREVERIARPMADALIDAVQRESSPALARRVAKGNVAKPSPPPPKRR
jgi:hypothetical protein